MRTTILSGLAAFLMLLSGQLGAQDSFDEKLQTEAIRLPAELPAPQRESFYYDTAPDESKWGDLKLRFVYDGDWPKPQKIITNRGGPMLESEGLVVSAKDMGIANVAVWLYHTSDQPPLPVHPSYAKTAGADVEIKTQGLAFVPHVTIVRTSQKLVVSNPDPHGYNVKAEFFHNPSFNNLIPSGRSFETRFSNPEQPSKLEDSIHGWMNAYLLIRGGPYAALSDKSGNLKLARLPVVVWQERAGYVKEATLGGEKVKWERGRVNLDIQPGENDLGTIKLAPQIFKR